jgi:hypothetical protein
LDDSPFDDFQHSLIFGIGCFGIGCFGIGCFGIGCFGIG